MWGLPFGKKIKNSRKKALSSLPPSELFLKLVNVDIFLQYIERSLGMSWNIESDNFIFKHVKKEANVMKRVILSSVLLIFDPLGNVTPAILDAKLII